MANQSSIILFDYLCQKSLLLNDDSEFQLASGAKSKYYIDCKIALSYSPTRKAAGQLIFERCKEEELQAVGGLVLGAYPIAASVSDAFYETLGKEVRAFVVRKEPKEHGRRRLIEGDIRPGDHALIVDDVITSGSSAIKAISSARNSGMHVSRVIALIDREEGGRENIEKQDVKFEALFTLADLVKGKSALGQGRNSYSDRQGIIPG